ncbi:MAG: DUF3667 domain-containing protein [Bacteroidetes bacterium]|nr:MAG: DUF3667 domain-containing protein [Bacteroidota bacterium]
MQKEINPGQDGTTPEPEQVCCKNCSHTYTGNFCPQCGQSAKDFDRPLKFFFVDFAGNIFAFDTRLWQSLKDILLHPGRMEANYISGKRIRYMPPFRLYVFVSFIFFLSLSWAARNSINKNKSELHVQTSQALADSIYKDIREKHPEINIALHRNKGKNLSSSGLAKPSGSFAEEEDSVPEISDPTLPKASGKMDHIMKNPEMYMERFFKYASWSLFLLMPFYGFLLWLNFRKSKRHYISHFLLSINQHVFIFVILLLMLFVGMLFPDKSIYPEKYLLYLFPAYAWVGTVRLYQKNWLKAGLRLLVLIVFYLFVVALVTAFIAWWSFT